MNALDDILARGDSPPPTSGFVGSVMAAVHRAAAVPPLRFPWRQVTAAVGVAAVVGVLAAPWLAAPVEALVRELREPFVMWSLVACLGTLLGGWVGVELAEA